MKRIHKEALVLSLVDLSEDMNHTLVLVHLQSAKILNGPQIQQIQANKTCLQINTKLIEMLMHGGPDAFEVFLNALNRTNQGHLKTIVRNNLLQLFEDEGRRRSPWRCKKNLLRTSLIVIALTCCLFHSNSFNQLITTISDYRLSGTATYTIKDYYRTALLQHNPFFLNFTFDMETMWVNLTLTKNEIQTDNYFDLIRTALESNQMLYIEGKTATGKTLLLRKIAYDWAKGRLPEFDLVLLAEFRHLSEKYESITNVALAGIKKMLPECNILSELHFRKKVLLLVDGYDEALTNQCSELDIYLSETGPKPFLPFSYIIASRPGKIEGPQESRYALINIQGFVADKQKLAYISAHFANHPNKNEQIKIVSRKLEINNNLNKIATTPLYLAFICLVHEQIVDGTIFELYTYVIWWLLERYRKDRPNSDEDDVPIMFGYTEYSNKKRKQVIENHFLEFPLLRKLGKMAFELHDINNFTEAHIENYEIAEGAFKVGLVVREDIKQAAWTVTKYEFPHRTVQEFLAGGIFYFWPELLVKHPLLHAKIFDKNLYQKPIIYKDDSEYQMLQLERFAWSAELTNSAVNPHLSLIKNNLLEFFKKYKTLSFDVSLIDSDHANQSKLNTLLQKCSQVKDLFLYTSEDEIELSGPINLTDFKELKYIGFYSLHFSNSLSLQHDNANSRSPSLIFNASSSVKKITFLHCKFRSANYFLGMMKNLNYRQNEDNMLIQFFYSTIVMAELNVGIKEVGFIMNVQSLEEYNRKIMNYAKRFEREAILYLVFSHLCKASTLVLVSSDLNFQSPLIFPLLEEVYVLELQKFNFSEHETYALLLHGLPMLGSLRFKDCSFTLPVWQSIVDEIRRSKVSILTLHMVILNEEDKDYFIRFHKLLESCHTNFLFISYNFASFTYKKLNMTTVLASLAKNMVKLKKLVLLKNDDRLEVSESDVRKAGKLRKKNFEFVIAPMYEKGRGTIQSDKETFKWYKEAAEQGDAHAQTKLGSMYMMGESVPQSDEDAFKWYQKAAEQGDAYAQYNLGTMYEQGQGIPQSNDGAFKWYKEAAEQGDASAQFNLGRMYEKGKGVPQSDETAFKWYQKAANQRHVDDAQNNLGFMYAKGKGVPQSDEDAFKWFQKAAEQGDASAQFNLGIMFVKGQGVPQSYKEAFKLFQKAANQGVASAQNYLGVLYKKGKGVPQSDEEAVKWFEKAANQGNVHAQNTLGSTYVKGEGVPQSDEKAFKWYKEAAEQGYGLAQFNVGAMYGKGQGIPQSDEEAFKWYKKAANLGMAKAQLNLSGMYAKGIGVPQSQEEALKWLQKAAEQRYVDDAPNDLGYMDWVDA